MPETLETTSLLANTYEPKRKFRWILSIDGIEGFMMKTAARPQATFEETVIDYINAKRYLAGKMAYNTIQCTCYDPIAPSAAQQIMEWLRLNYEPLTGRAGYASFYKKDFTLKLLDPQGTIVEQWDIKGGWAQDVNFGDLDYASSDAAEVSFTLRYDTAILVY
jgi:hypothetical protein